MKGISAAAAVAAFVMLFTSSASAVVGEQQTIQNFSAKPALSAEISNVGSMPSTALYSAGLRTAAIPASARLYIGSALKVQIFRAFTTVDEKNKGSRIMSFTFIDPAAEVSEQMDIISGEDKTEDITSETDELREYALETQDAQCLKYLHMLEEEGTSAGSEKKTGSRLYGFYGSDELIHNSRFDGVTKDYGIDVSYFQPNIDWNKVKSSGVTFAVIRLGYRSYVKKGTLVVDRDFYKNIRGAKAAGIQVGVYFYTQATTPAEAREEADFVVSTLGGERLDLPVFYDIETADFAPEPGRLDSAGLTVSEKTQLCRSFCDRIVEKGYWSSIYANTYWLDNMIEGHSLSNDYPIWVATYGKSTAFTGQYDMWQYSSKGKIDGISGNVDLNVRYYVDHAPTNIPTCKFSNGTLSWNSVGMADGYEVYGVDNSDNVHHLTDVSGTSFDVTDPKYKAYFVKPYDLYGGRRYTGRASDQVDAVGKVGLISCERIGIDKVRFSWAAVEGASGYEVYTDVSGSDTFLCDTNKTTAELSGKDLQNHKVKIRAYNSARIYGKYSEPQHIKGNMPDKDINLSCSDGVLLWDLNDDCDGYTVFCSSNSTGHKEYDTSALFFCIDRNIDAIYEVKAYCELEGKKFYSQCSSVVETKAVTSPPKGRVELSITGGANSTLSWNRIDDADGYAVFRTDSSGNGFEIGKTDMTEYYLSETNDGKFFVKPYRLSGDEVLYGDASQTIGLFNANVIDVREVISDDEHCIVTWSCSQYCDEYEIYTDDELLSSVRGDMAVIDKENLANVVRCTVRPVRYDNGTAMYGAPERIKY